MQIKTYQTDSVPRVMEQIRQELGPNAVILDTQKVRKRRFLGLFDKLAYTVTAASEPRSQAKYEKTMEPRPDTYEPATTPLTPDGRLLETGSVSSTADFLSERSWGKPADLRELSSKMENLNSDVRRLKQMLGEGSRSLGPASEDLLSAQLWRLLQDTLGTKPDWIQTRSVLEEFQYLREQGVDDGIAASLLQSSWASIDRGREVGAQLRRRLNQTLASMVHTSPFQEKPHSPGRAIFFGPTGVGKTTTIAKLTAALTIREQRKVQLITLDTYRIAAAEQLKIYAEIIGVPLRVVANVGELDQALSECPERSSVLVDTTGHSHKRVHEFQELASYLCDHPGIERHLVLSSTTKSQDLREILLGFKPFAPDKLLFTKVDETSTLGAIANSLIGTGKPLSYLTNGQAVPEDLLFPTPALVGDMLLPIN